LWEESSQYSGFNSDLSKGGRVGSLHDALSKSSVYSKKPKRKAVDEKSSSSKQIPVLTSVLSPSTEKINTFFSELANNEHPVVLLSQI
jgi:hypothetical protein